MKIKLIAYALLLVTAAMLSFYYFFNSQTVITYERCNLCDGNQYLKIYHFLKGNTEEYKVSFPYHSRIMLPLLSSVLPVDDPFFAFTLINLLFVVLGVLALYILWLHFQIPWHLMTLGFFWLLFHWTGLIRLNALDPITTDVPLYFLQAVLILLVIQKKYSWLIWFGPLSVVFKESVLVLLLVLIIYALVMNRFSAGEKLPVKVLFIAFAMTILMKGIINLVFIPGQEGYSSVRLVLFYLKEVWYDPFRIFRWIAGLFTAFGPFLLMLLFRFKWKDILDREKGILIILAGTTLALSLLGGQDHTRIAFLAFPFLMTWILIELRSADWRMLLVMFLFSIPLMRIFEEIPDPGQDFSSFALWYPEYAPEYIVVGSIAYTSLYVLILLTIHLLKQGRN